MVGQSRAVLAGTFGGAGGRLVLLAGFTKP